MSTFEVKAYKLKIEEHPNADVLELAVIGDYRSIVRKGQFKTGDLAIYIPEAAIVPDWIIAKLGLTGKLAGKDKNRVKAMRLRGIVSQGLVLPLELRENTLDVNTNTWGDHYVLVLDRLEGHAGYRVNEGDDVTERLDIVKWEPPIPVHMAGEVDSVFGKTISYDIENLKRFPTIFEDGEDVVITEKLHGTWCCFGYHPDLDNYIVTSKGLSEKGLVFKLNGENDHNLYVRALASTVDSTGYNVIERANNISDTTFPFYILGEVFGLGVQDFAYGDETEPKFRIFDVYVGKPGAGHYMDANDVAVFANKIGVETVPVLFRGSYSSDVVVRYTSGKETVSGKETNIREGIVIRPIRERRNDELGRVILKSVSDAYLLRKGKKITEYT